MSSQSTHEDEPPRDQAVSLCDMNTCIYMYMQAVSLCDMNTCIYMYMHFKIPRSMSDVYMYVVFMCL